jgi:hypothetical protein
VGSTQVGCSVTDADGKTATSSFTVTVTPLPLALSQVAPVVENAATPFGAPAFFAFPTASGGTPAYGPVTCDYQPGDTFPNGVTTVHCVVHDAASASATSNFTVTVTAPPPLTLDTPNPVTVPATTASGAVVSYPTPAAHGGFGGYFTQCVPASGSTFAIGQTSVNCSTRDSQDQTATSHFTVTVTAVPLTLSTPANITVDATSGTGAVVTYALPSASGGFPPYGTVTCSPASGTTFSIGATHTVNCSVTDHGAQTATSHFNIKVNPLLVLTVPANITVDATSPSGAVVTFATSASGGSGTYTIACSKVSGATFAIGTTTVSCTVNDGLSTKTGSFTVTVNSATTQLTNLSNAIATMGFSSSYSSQISAVKNDLTKNNLPQACIDLNTLIAHFQAQSGKQLTPAQATFLINKAKNIKLTIGCTN